MYYEPRSYRNWVNQKDLFSFKVVVEESDCQISASADIENKARKAIIKYRDILKKYIKSHPSFISSLEPVKLETGAPLIVRAMAEAAQKANVGPMAAVAGAVAQFTGQDLDRYVEEIIIENGGDIYLKSKQNRLIGIYAGSSPLTGRIGIEIEAGDTPLGISTSSGTVGHSLSFGRADAVIILSPNALLADASATAIGNIVFSAADISKGLERAQQIEGIKGIIIIKGEDLGIWGDIRIKKTETD